MNPDTVMCESHSLFNRNFPVVKRTPFKLRIYCRPIAISSKFQCFAFCCNTTKHRTSFQSSIYILQSKRIWTNVIHDERSFQEYVKRRETNMFKIKLKKIIPEIKTLQRHASVEGKCSTKKTLKI